jgi:long-chain fatty acid transport protein
MSFKVVPALALVLALLVLGFVRPVHASPLFEMIGGFGGQGALQARHAGPSAASAYFNPALLPDAPSGLSAGFLVLRHEIGISVDPRTAGADVPDAPGGTYNARHSVASTDRLPFYPVPTEWLRNGRPANENLSVPLAARPRQHAGSGHQTVTYEAVGLVVKAFKERFAFGVYVLIPNVNFAQFTTFFANEKEQFASNSLHPEMYGDRMRAVSLAFAGGVRITNTFSLGLGATVGLRAVAGAHAYVADANDLANLDLNIDADAKISLVPHLGVSWKPQERVHLTGTVHVPQKLDVEADFRFLLATGSESASGLAFSFDFMPWQAGAGVGVDVIKRSGLLLNLTISALYGRWAKYIDRQSIRPSGAYEWRDTLSGAAGLRMETGPVSIALDGQYKPTPVPLQTGRYSYVDNDRFGLALAVDYGFSLWEQPLKLGVMLQGYRMIQRHQTKLPTPTNPDGVNRTPELVVDEIPDDAVISGEPIAGREGLQTNNPGWPGFTSVGWICSAGLHLTVVL